ncbi:MAG: CBS and ACT domain-containing protein [Gracilibacteraceae bacterium]|jgi:acetoin utilization protein AcuB|nr:CBS and ACT domain-containing protein [Gracilibacteraceae bacterium]
MYVEQFMTSQVFTVKPNDSILLALDMMKSKNISRLPVLQGGRLAGIVTDGDLRSAQPSPVTTLSRFEMTELLAKVMVADVATKKVITCPPHTLLEDAAATMRRQKIGALPVMDGETLAGIITENDLLDAFLDVMGAHSPGMRVVVQTRDRVGVFQQITTIILGFGLDITSMAVYHLPNRNVQILLRLNGDGAEDAIAALRTAGFDVSV